ncbi:MAG: hypothetical protein CL969_00575 [Euryarchaeota archaeon]|jgi:adenylate kinase|nr:hypothetical protein [Euryarchaeota archaeon]DAC49895.1 MAG TPA: hypothetical protein D7H97_04610 [Candidatus Poseidoniales archaeon]|tara:strand:- start:35 stop:616 length:582 start_codon:yes stop_codon:yes gene_type:complete
MTNATNPYLMSRSDLCRISITGTPGCGKSSLANHACDKLAFELSQVSELAEKYGFIGEMDNDDARPIDIDGLAQLLEEKWKLPPTRITIIDGHLSHLLPVDAIVILRCNPEILSQRNKARGWSEAKIKENEEWELLGGAWNEYDEWKGIPCLELNSTAIGVDALFEDIEHWLRDGFKPEGPEEEIDWVSVLHG